MKSRQFIWLLLFSTALNLNSFALSKVSEESKATKKVFILIRSEHNQNQLEKFKEQINTDLMLQNVAVEIETYRRSEPLPQAKIFKTAYSGDYDVLLLIEQIAKYTIDNRVTNSMIKMGGKYKIRSYNLKESPYTWIDHGNSNCNPSVDLSLKAFTEKLLTSIDINIKPPVTVLNSETALVSNTNAADADMLLYYDLLKQIKTQRRKTKLLLFKIQELKNKLRIRSNYPENLVQLENN